MIDLVLDVQWKDIDEGFQPFVIKSINTPPLRQFKQNNPETVHVMPDLKTDDLLFIGKGCLAFRMVIKLAESVGFQALYGVDGIV